MTNPFDDKDGVFIVLRNAEGQHSLWPTFLDPPSGWELVCGPATKDECNIFIEEQWRDIRPSSLSRYNSWL